LNFYPGVSTICWDRYFTWGILQNRTLLKKKFNIHASIKTITFIYKNISSDVIFSFVWRTGVVYQWLSDVARLCSCATFHFSNVFSLYLCATFCLLNVTRLCLCATFHDNLWHCSSALSCSSSILDHPQYVAEKATPISNHIRTCMMFQNDLYHDPSRARTTVPFTSELCSAYVHGLLLDM
jgi:hypothetical protein